ncbi:MAG: hypothetical protein SAJ12_18040 [Jaaginema sp. PMC 1079.18]|nr:hypothetical protein [Jaaginema sp. PMC 1080.18]MEC4852885.1 hypothetical protein [Jaaginema sp. PMC 1079.18]MEC4868234.1 hypothetical protein [Jaaginema sp. PMC 1078.18]
MGRQAKQKKLRQTQTPTESTETTQFVRQLQRQGYNLKQAEHSPEIPEDKPEPQV